MNDKSRHVNFDEYAEDYEKILQKQLSFFSKDHSYFAEYKVDIVSQICRIPPLRIVDFGCGIGLSIPHLAHRFPNAQICVTDVSTKCLDYVRSAYPNIQVLSDHQLEGCAFDLIFVSGVFHHIRSEQRPLVMKRLAGLLTKTGMLSIFEHNPYNPVTRRMVATCPFDASAELITRKGMQILVDNAGLNLSHSGYCLFLPQMLQRLRAMEKTMAWLPLGGQYYIAAGKEKVLPNP